MLKRLYVLLLGAACALAQTVEGSVINSVTGKGVAGAAVDLIQVRAFTSTPDGRLEKAANRLDARAGKAAHSTTTDAQGHFHIEDVTPGAYTARYSAQNYLDEAAAPGGLDVPPQFQVAAGGGPVKLEGRLIPMCRLSGRVIDGRGDPIPHALLYVATGHLLEAVDLDANGKFDLRRLPGAYTLSVAPPVNVRPPDPEPGADGVLTWARTYYPGVVLPEAASKMMLLPGAEMLGIEIKVRAVAAHSIRGVLLKPDGSPAPKTQIYWGLDLVTRTTVESKSDGSFEFPAVLDGDWEFSATVESGGVKLWTMEWVRMAGRDVEGVKLRLHEPFTVRGKVIMEAPAGWPAPKPPAVMLSLANRGRGSVPLRNHYANPDAAGNFSLDLAFPGGYRLLNSENLPQAYYLDAVRLGDAVIPAPEIEFSSAVAALTLVYKTNGGTLRGKAENCAKGGVLLVPQDHALRWPASIYSARCDSNDRYEVTAVRPGDYYAIAFQDVSYSQHWSPKFDDSTVNQSSRVTVRAGEANSIDLRAIAQQQ